MVVDENTLDKSVSQSPTRSKCADSWCGHVLRIYKRKGMRMEKRASCQALGGR